MPSTTSTIPATARAAVITKIKQDLEIKDVKVVQPSELAPGECLVKVDYAGCCHSDISIRDNDWGITRNLPLIGGHEGVGHVVAIGANTIDSPVKVGDRVGMKWVANACLKCEKCTLGYESLCDIARRDCHGCGVDGTFAEYTRCWVNYVTPIPEGLDSAAVTPILCAGLTIYGGLKKSGAKPGQWVALTGAGGGLGHLGIQYAVAMGLRVIAIDTGASKRDLCMKLGAEKWVDYLESKDLVQDVKEASGGPGPHAAVIAVGHELPLTQAVLYIRDAGTISTVGMPGPSHGNLNVPIAFIVTKGIHIVGSATGNRKDMAEALDFVTRGKVKCHYEVRNFEEVNTSLRELTNGKVTGRIVLKIA
jgi:alcohol dehydrogenase, propanol-preferring